ncbi:hypothetical protein BH09PSE5_BH09PSE5_37030 [soil metagenome]
MNDDRPSEQRRFTIVIPVLGQLHYTRQCVDSLLAIGVEPRDILVIDNASPDDTPQWLAANPELRSTSNKVNLGCGGAWAQGSFMADSEWVVLLNNDVIAGPNAINAMLDAADREKLDVVSPALLEGELDYDFTEFAPRFLKSMSGVVRRGWFHGVCFAVRRHVFEKIGFVDTDRRLGGHEDKEFLMRCLNEGVPVGTVGDSVFHHFGSITQAALKRELQIKQLGDHHYFYRKMGLGFWGRKMLKQRTRAQQRRWIEVERKRAGFSLHMLRKQQAWGLH